jgi:hypothetical protein
MTRNWKLITIGCLVLVAAVTSIAFAAGPRSTSSSGPGASPAAWHPRGGGRFFSAIGDRQRFAADVARSSACPRSRSGAHSAAHGPSCGASAAPAVVVSEGAA